MPTQFVKPPGKLVNGVDGGPARFEGLRGKVEDERELGFRLSDIDGFCLGERVLLQMGLAQTIEHAFLILRHD
ncbi:MAG: hypothetical protein ACXIVF_17930 [Rhizobiaceae bacterium]